MAIYVVTGARQITVAGGPTGQQRVWVVAYKVGDWGPFEVEIPENKFTPEEVARVVGAQAAVIAGLQSGGA